MYEMNNNELHAINKEIQVMVVTTWLPIELKLNNNDYTVEYNWQEIESTLY